jgi:hypothetical protein
MSRMAVECGQRVHVLGTSVASGHDALFESVVGDGKMRLMLDMMGRYVPIDVDERDVVEVERKHKRRGRKNRRHHRSRKYIANTVAA